MRSLQRLGKLGGWVIGCLVIVWSLRGVEFSPTEIIKGTGTAAERARDLWPPAWELARDPRFQRDLIVTVQIALVATVLAGLFAFPASFLAARTTAFSARFAVSFKFVLNLFRGIPPLLYALLIINLVGLGALPGTLAVAFASFCMMTKMFAETLETLDPGPIEAVRAVGASPAQVFAWGMLPQALPNFLGLGLYVFEVSLAASFILGIVGAGGMGFQLQTALRLGRWEEASFIMLVIMTLVVAVDLISFRLRKSLA